jgi:hypothetical protein
MLTFPIKYVSDSTITTRQSRLCPLGIIIRNTSDEEQ